CVVMLPTNWTSYWRSGPAPPVLNPTGGGSAVSEESGSTLGSAGAESIVLGAGEASESSATLLSLVLEPSTSSAVSGGSVASVCAAFASSVTSDCVMPSGPGASLVSGSVRSALDEVDGESPDVEAGAT